MGIVYLARDVALERPVAIKVLAPALAARRDMRERFLREARTAAQCFHPHIVPIHAVEEADDLAWIVMAYVRGETLAARLRRTGTMPADELRRLAREVGCALSYAHQCGIVHRDITPENLLIGASTGRYVIADFGIAHLIDQHITPVGGSVAGTARYMAPEQALGEAIDGRADLYALGVTLFIAVTGRAPFDGKSALALVAEHMTQIVPSVRSFAPTVPLPLARAIDRCLAKRPDDRFVDAGQFLAVIEPDVREAALAPALRSVQSHAAASRRRQPARFDRDWLVDAESRGRTARAPRHTRSWRRYAGLTNAVARRRTYRTTADGCRRKRGARTASLAARGRWRSGRGGPPVGPAGLVDAVGDVAAG